MNILITGGSGFIGSNYINFLFSDNKDVNIVNIDALYYCSNNDNIDKNIRESNRYTFINGSVCDYNLLEKIINKHNITHIIHFAAQSHVDNSFNESIKYTNDNVIGTNTLLEAIKNINKNIILLHFSTDEVYGESDFFDSEKTEDSVLCPTNPYAASKAAAEMYVKSYIYSFNLKIIIARCNNVFGKNQYHEKLIPKFIKLLNENKKCTIQGDGNNLRNFIHIDDVCSAIDYILKYGTFGEIYNIGSDKKYEKSVLEISKMLIKKIKHTDEYHKHITNVKDRPFNDKRYLISNIKLKQLGWKQEKQFDIEIDYLINNNLENNNLENNNLENNIDFGFIISRNVYDNDSNLNWISIYNEIRKYSNCEIIFICKSDESFINFDKKLVNCKIIKNKFHFDNNLTLYHYFYINKFFKKAIIIDDKLDLNLIKNLIDCTVKKNLLVIFKKNIQHNYLNKESTLLNSIIEDFSDKFKIKDKFKKCNWNGCRKMLSIIDIKILNNLQNKFDILKYNKGLDYDTFNTLENLFGFLLSIYE